MKYAYATLLLNETGAEINEDNLKAVLEASQADVTESRIKALVAATEDLSLDDYRDREVLEAEGEADASDERDVEAETDEVSLDAAADGQPVDSDGDAEDVIVEPEGDVDRTKTDVETDQQDAAGGEAAAESGGSE